MAIDQAHEQNNSAIKGVGGAVRLLSQDRDEAIWRLEITGPRVVRLLNKYEKMKNFIILVLKQILVNTMKTILHFRKCFLQL